MFPDTQVKSKHFKQLALLIVGTRLINPCTSQGVLKCQPSQQLYVNKYRLALCCSNQLTNIIKMKFLEGLQKFLKTNHGFFFAIVSCQSDSPTCVIDFLDMQYKLLTYVGHTSNLSKCKQARCLQLCQKENVNFFKLLNNENWS